jgi:hypothetical protein
MPVIGCCRSAATDAFALGIGAAGLRAAATLPAVAPQHGVDDRGGAADAGLNGNGVGRAIQAAGAAFHAGIAIPYDHMPAVHLEHLMGANIQTHPATGAFAFVQLQSDNIFKINQILHF